MLWRTTAATLVLLGVPLAATAEESVPLGKQIADFQLPDCLGATQALKDFSDKKAVVIVFLGTECPLAKLYGPKLAELAGRYEAQGVQFVGIDSNLQDSPTEIANYARLHQIQFPLLKDPGNKVADQFGATRTPEVFLLDEKRTVRYWGPIDDQHTVGVTRPAVKQEYLATALDELLAGQIISGPVQPSVGCHIGRVSRKTPSGEVTYSKHIARIVNRHCIECHRPGQVAPFAMTSYDEIVGWAETIGEAVRDERMPPWRANPHFGKFRNDARLSEADKQLIHQWVQDGAPEGNREDLPELPKFAEGWRIPQPDLVLRMPQAFKVPARGVVPYQHFTVDPQFKEDVWIRGAEGRPGNRSVVHHMLLFFVPPGRERQPQDALNNAVASFVPGMPAYVEPGGYAIRIPAGSKLIFQMHYTPTGIEQDDQSEAGLVFADPKSIHKEVRQASALTWQFQIPPGDADHRVEARYRFFQDVDLYTLMPHMHLRGKSFRFTAVYPDRREEVLLDVPRYDCNWQNVYFFAEPKRMPDGTELVCVARFDNSVQNPVNPDPTKAVHWGDQTWEEMMVGSFSMTVADQDLTLGPPQARPLDDGRYSVRFRYKPAQPAEAVYLAGEFNHWKPTDHKMDGPGGDGYYSTEVVLGPGRHEYKFVVNGTIWRPDPGNRVQTGDFHNSVVLVGKEP